MRGEGGERRVRVWRRVELPHPKLHLLQTAPFLPSSFSSPFSSSPSSPSSPSFPSSPSSFRPAPNHHLLKAMARNGGGCAEYFDSKTKSKWERKVRSQLSKAFQPALTSVSVQWQQFDEDAPKPVQVSMRANTHTHSTHTPPHLPSSPPPSSPGPRTAGCSL